MSDFRTLLSQRENKMTRTDRDAEFIDFLHIPVTTSQSDECNEIDYTTILSNIKEHREHTHFVLISPNNTQNDVRFCVDISDILGLTNVSSIKLAYIGEDDTIRTIDGARYSFSFNGQEAITGTIQHETNILSDNTLLLLESAIYSHNTLWLYFDNDFPTSDFTLKLVFTEPIFKKQMRLKLMNRNIFVRLPTKDGFEFFLKHQSFTFGKTASPLNVTPQTPLSLTYVSNDKPTEMQLLCEYIVDKFKKNENQQDLNDIINDIEEYENNDDGKCVIIPSPQFALYPNIESGITIVSLACGYKKATLTNKMLFADFSSYKIDGDVISIKWMFRRCSDAIGNIQILSHRKLAKLNMSLSYSFAHENDVSYSDVENIFDENLQQWCYDCSGVKLVELYRYPFGVSLQLQFSSEDQDAKFVRNVIRNIYIRADMTDYCQEIKNVPCALSNFSS